MRCFKIGLGFIIALGLAGRSVAQDAVQWRVEDGGNGHWYAFTTSVYGLWTECRTAAEARGATLAQVKTASLQNFIVTLANTTQVFGDYWIGASQQRGSEEPAGGWKWIDGDPLAFDAWGAVSAGTGAPPSPNDWPSSAPGDEDFLEICFRPGIISPIGSWDDQGAFANPSLIEWSADCNNDGIVDYGQILAGQLADANANGVPDVCEVCANPWLPIGDSLAVPTQADAWYGPGAQFLDANGDGLKDVVFASQPLQCRLGLGGGRFGPTIVSEPLGWFGGYCVADFNTDGRDDFVSYDYFAGRDRVMLSLGDGRFAQSQALVTGNYAATCRAGDMDGDGDLDIVGGTELEGYLRIFRNNGAGLFDAGVTIGGMGQYHREMELADLDGDGDLDIVVQNEWIYQTIRILRNDGGMVFTQMAALSYPGGALNLVVTDYDRDGDVDIVASTQLGDLRVYSKNPQGINYTQIDLGSYSNRSLGLELFDYDSDGLRDLFMADNNRFGIARSKPIGGFEPPLWQAVPNKDRFTLVDIDANGSMNVAAGKQTPQSLGTIDFLSQGCNTTTCVDADLFRDFNVNGADLGILLSQWGPANPNTVSDINHDGVVNGADLAYLLSSWGPCPN
jgi:hypothetical protein